MSKLKQDDKINMKTCNMCNKSSAAEGDALIYFGEWMTKRGITVHYYCLLLSTHLPQHGQDHEGILGFLLRDIRREIEMAKKRKCMYCLEFSATIQCFTCKKYYHLTCGHTNKCLSQFAGDFISYCLDCVPVDQYEKELLAKKPLNSEELCFICARKLVIGLKRLIYAKCCGSGFIHSHCMKKYALSAGYYLICIWCKDKQFREDVKYLGVFVPDREANWENKGAYSELYRRHSHCEMEVCNCPKGRYYTNASKWQLIICDLCGAFGAHNPCCIPGFEGSKKKLTEFKCDICSATQKIGTTNDLINTSLYVSKNKLCNDEPVNNLSKSVNFDSSGECNFTQQTIFNVKPNFNSAITICEPDGVSDGLQIASAVYTLTQSPSISPKLAEPNSSMQKIINEDNVGAEESVIADLLVQRMLDIFDGKSITTSASINSLKPHDKSENVQIGSADNTLTQSPSIRQENGTPNTDNGDMIADLLVQRMLDIFDI